MGAKQKEKYLQSFIGKTLEIVPELFDGEYTEGYAENYIRVYAVGETPKERVQVCVESLFKDGVKAVIKRR